MSQPLNSRRLRLRHEATREIKQLAMRQVAASGAAGISMAAIAKQMGMTGPALYRYFASRDALLTALIRDAYADLAETAEQAATRESASAPLERLLSVAGAIRGWALAEPHRYLLLFGTPVTGYTAPMDTLDAANRTLRVFVAISTELPQAPSPSPTRDVLENQLEALAQAEFGASGRALMMATTIWTRIHGVISLDVIGQFTHMHLDAALLLEHEVSSVARHE